MPLRISSQCLEHLSTLEAWLVLDASLFVCFVLDYQRALVRHYALRGYLIRGRTVFEDVLVKKRVILDMQACIAGR
jgi:hypothetical protein